MEKIEFIRELTRNQADLMEEYSRLIEIKRKLLLRFEEVQNELDGLLPHEFGPPRDAFIDLPGRLRNYDLEAEARRIVDALSRIIGHLSTSD